MAMRVWKDGDPLPEDAGTQVYAIIGRRGSGKTYCAICLAEQLLKAGTQVIAFDPIGVWWGLRLAADGKSRGFDIPVFGGLHGDLELSDTAGRLIADALVDSGSSAVIDVSMMTKAGQRRFMADFAEHFLHRKMSVRSRAHLIMEECQEFVPQNATGSERMVGAIQTLTKLGRNLGIGVTFVTQRPQAASKDALNQAEVLIALQMNGPHERKAIAAWVKEKDDGRSEELLGSLPSLKVGEAVVWSPGWLGIYLRTKIVRKTTFDASATPTNAASAQVKLKPLNLDALKKAIATAEEKKAAGGHTKKARAAAPNGAVAVHVASRQDEKALAAAQLRAKRVLVGLVAVAKKLRALADDVDSLSASFESTPTNAQPLVHRAATEPTQKPSGLARAPFMLLEALARWHPKALTRAQLSTQSGYSITSSGFGNALSTLRTAGYINDVADRRIEITAAGMAAVGAVPPAPKTPTEVIEAWRTKIHDKAPRTLFDALVDAYPKAVSRDELSALTGYSITSSGFSNALSRLRTNELIEDSPDRSVRAARALFMEEADI